MEVYTETVDNTEAYSLLTY